MNRIRTRMGWGILSLIFGLSLSAGSTPAGADDDFSPVYHPELTIKRTSGKITIDGELHDPGWIDAAQADNFAEHNPGDQTRPAVDTSVLLTYDDDHLYVAWICYDDPGEVRASFCERDDIFSDDYVILLLDPFGKSTMAYEIAANPYGIHGDLLFSSGNGEDISYDMIFESSGRITDEGWVVEMAIPFAGMRFPSIEEQVWRVDFWRNRPRESRYQYSWSAYNRDENCWPCQWGTVRGLAGVKPGSGLELLPAVVAHQSGSLDDDGTFNNGDIKGDIALGVSYNISSELTAQATVNPDFSQVESDAPQIDVNSTFALFYPERRPFFQEGSDLFNTYFNAVYTRSINDPTVAGKLTWRKGKNSVALLSARDEHSVIILPFEEQSEFVENGKSYSNIVRARHDLGDQSHIGLVATDRRFDGGGSGSLVGIDGHIRFTKSDAILFQLLGTYTDEVDNPTLVADSVFNATTFDDEAYTAGLDGENFWGHGLLVALEHAPRDYWMVAEYWERAPTFRADAGFEPSNSIRHGELGIGGIYRFEKSTFFENINGEVRGAQKYNFMGIRKDEWVNFSQEFRFRTAQTGIHSSYMRSNELFRDILFTKIWQAHTCISTQPIEELRFGGNINYGHRIARHDLVMGKELRYGLWATIKPVSRLLISTEFSRITSDELETDENLFKQSVFRTYLGLQITRELSTRVITQYNDRWDTWDVDPLITYRLNPFSIFYIGSTRDYRDLTFEEDGRDGWTLTDRQYFLKVQYLFQL